MQVPRALYVDPQLPPAAVALWAVLLALVLPDRPEVAPSRRHLASCVGLVDVDAVSRLTAALSRAGHLDVQQVRVGRGASARTRNRYRPLSAVQPNDGLPYVEVPRAALALLRDGQLSAAVLVAYCQWADDCGTGGWTADSLAHHAERWGGHVKTERRHRLALVAAGLLAVEESLGRPSVTSLQRQAAPSSSRDTPPIRGGTTPPTARGTTPPTGRGTKYLPPESTTSREHNLARGPARRDLTKAPSASQRRRRATAGRLLRDDRALALLAEVRRGTFARCLVVVDALLEQGAAPADVARLLRCTEGQPYDRVTAVRSAWRAEQLAGPQQDDDRPWNEHDAADLAKIVAALQPASSGP